MNPSDILLVSLVGGLIGLDRTAVFQVMISRPIVAAPIIGAVLGDPMAGLKVGLVIELLWIGYLPVGASVPPDETIVSIVVTAVTVWCRDLYGLPGDGAMALATVLVIPTAVIAQRVDSRVREMNIASAHAADRFAEKGDFKGVQRECLKGVGRFFTAYSLILLALLPTVTAAVVLVHPLLPGFVLKGLERFYYILPLIGIVSVLSAARTKNALGLFLLSFAFAFGLIEVLGGG